MPCAFRQGGRHLVSRVLGEMAQNDRSARGFDTEGIARSFGSWRIGDPAVQYETRIQEMHTSKNSGKISSSNPCSEYMFLNDTSCNLNSLNLLKFADKEGNLSIESLEKAFPQNKISLINRKDNCS